MLVCNAGMSTAMLAQKINKNCDGYCYVEAFGEGEYMEHIENIDVILVGPQIRHLIPSIKKTTQNKIPVSYINPMDYGMMRVDNVISQIKEMLEGQAMKNLEEKILEISAKLGNEVHLKAIRNT